MPHVCPTWEYEKIAGYQAILAPRVRKLEPILLTPGHDTLKAIQDTKLVHRAFFTGLTPALNPNFAGNYRGSSGDKCLRHYRVGVGGDNRVGAPPDEVAPQMQSLATLMKDVIGALDGASANLSESDRLTSVVVVGCQLLVTFLSVHPYVNGNGHIARFIMWAIFARYGFRFRHTFQIDPKPPFIDQYGKNLSLYRDGSKDPLHKFIAQCVVRSP